MLLSYWINCWSRITTQNDGFELLNRLVSAYQEPQRHYHTLQHLTECLALMQQYRHLAEEPCEVEMALWFHDAVYDVKAHDNEARSAEWAVKELTNTGVAAARIERIRELILATRHSGLPQGQDQQLLVDIDLAILAAAPPRFSEYEQQVRKEYSWVPAPVFRQKRAEVLQGFLERAVIYNTPALREAWETKARTNLERSLRELNAEENAPPQ